MSLPSVGLDDTAMSYKFIHKFSGEQVADEQTLGEAGLHRMV